MMYKRTARVKRFLKINVIIYTCIYIYLYMPGQTESTLTTPQVRNIRCTEQVHVNNCKDQTSAVILFFVYRHVSSGCTYFLPHLGQQSQCLARQYRAALLRTHPLQDTYEKGWKKGTGREKEEGRRRKYMKMLEEINKIPQKISTDNVPLPSKSKSTIRVSRCSDQCMAV